MGLLNVPWGKTSSTQIKDSVLCRSCRILSTEAVLPQHSVRKGSFKVLHPWLQENAPCHLDWPGLLMFSGQDSLGKHGFMPVGLRLCRFSLTSRKKEWSSLCHPWLYFIPVQPFFFFCCPGLPPLWWMSPSSIQLGPKCEDAGTMETGLSSTAQTLGILRDNLV